LRFAVRRLGIPEASPRSHRMPCGDVPGRVHVSVQRVSAGHAAEQGLALAAACCDVPARRATLARVRGTYFLHPAGGLVLQAADQQAPPRSHDFPVETGLGPHVPARLPDRAPGGAGHDPDLEILDTDHVEPPCDVRRGLLAPVLADVRTAGLEPGSRVPDPLAAFRAALTLASFRSSRRSRTRCGARRPGQCSSSPVDRAALTATPRSTPTLSPVPGPLTGFGRTANATCQRPARSSFTRNDFTSCGTCRDQRNRTHPALGTRTSPMFRLSRRTCPGLTWTMRNPSSRPAFRHDGRRCVPHVPGVRAMTQERRFLGIRWHQPVSGHAVTVAAGYDIPPRSEGHQVPSRPEGQGTLWRYW
jgi:hypothetical protein